MSPGGEGGKVLKVERRYKLDVVQGANWIKTIIDRDEPAKVFIDLGSMGAGVVDILRDWGGAYEKLTEGVNFGGAPQEPTLYTARGDVVPGPRNRRAEMWMRMKDWLTDPGGADIMDDDALHADLVAPGYKYDARQFLVLESKGKNQGAGAEEPGRGRCRGPDLRRPREGRKRGPRGPLEARKGARATGEPLGVLAALAGLNRPGKKRGPKPPVLAADFQVQK